LAYVYATLFTRDAGLALLDPLWRRLPWLAPYPRQIELEVTTACHLRCTFCEHTYWKERPRHMTREQFQRIMEMFPGLKWVGLTGIGSGFLNPHYLEMLRFLKTERKCYVEFFEHFHRIKREWLEAIVTLGVDKVWVSLENASAETYNRARVGSDFHTVIQNLNELIDIKLAQRSPLPELWFHFIVMRENLPEIEAYVEMVGDLTARIRHLSPPLIYFTNLLGFEEVKDFCVTVPAETRQRVEEACRKRGIFQVWNENVTHSKPMRQCTKWTEPFILVSGHLQPCCALNEANARPYQEQHAFINVFEEDFHRFWRGEGLRGFLRTLRSGGINDVCRNCHVFDHPETTRVRSVPVSAADECPNCGGRP
jgi:MoaA/NifB/PqqE/SkfB family radical SAM enzyme